MMILANNFGNYFISKITKIHSFLDGHCTDQPVLPDEQTDHKFSSFNVIDEGTVQDLITKAPSKSCILDPIPTNLLKDCSFILLFILTRIVNISLQTGCFPSSWKNACSQLHEHMVVYDLYPAHQSAYRKDHSTETAIIKIMNDILLSMNDQRVTLLLLLDLSAAFDTVDHALLLQCLQTKFDICGTALVQVGRQDNCQYQPLSFACEIGQLTSTGYPSETSLPCIYCRCSPYFFLQNL